MPVSSDADFGFAPEFDAPVPYMLRTRDYYVAIGYTTPYRWAHYVDAPGAAVGARQRHMQPSRGVGERPTLQQQ